MRNSPQEIRVDLEVTAPPLAVAPSVLSWYHRIGTEPAPRSVSVIGNNVPWHAGVVPMDDAMAIQQAVVAGLPVVWQDGRFVIGGLSEGAGEDVPVVDWLDVNPTFGVATVGGTLVALDPIGSRIPYGTSQVAVVFVADDVADPRAVVVDVYMLSALSDGSDLMFLPAIEANR